MTRLQIGIVLAAVGWMAIVATALAWLHAAAIGSKQVDQAFHDHLEDHERWPG